MIAFLSTLLSVSFLISPLSKPLCDSHTWVIGVNPTQPFPERLLSSSIKRHEYLNMESVRDLELPARVHTWLPSSHFHSSDGQTKENEHLHKRIRYEQWNKWQQTVTGHTVSYNRFIDLEQQIKHHIDNAHSKTRRHVYLPVFWLFLESIQQHDPDEYCIVSPLIDSQTVAGSDYVYFDEKTDKL